MSEMPNDLLALARKRQSARQSPDEKTPDETRESPQAQPNEPTVDQNMPDLLTTARRLAPARRTPRHRESRDLIGGPKTSMLSYSISTQLKTRILVSLDHLRRDDSDHRFHDFSDLLRHALALYLQGGLRLSIDASDRGQRSSATTIRVTAEMKLALEEKFGSKWAMRKGLSELIERCLRSYLQTGFA